MNGPEHFKAAEDWLTSAKHAELGSRGEAGAVAHAIAHATLAVAAAIIDALAGYSDDWGSALAGAHRPYSSDGAKPTP